VRPKERPGSSSPETHRAWSAYDAVQNLGLLPLPPSAASSLVTAVVVIALYNALLSQSVYLFSIALASRHAATVCANTARHEDRHHAPEMLPLPDQCGMHSASFRKILSGRELLAYSLCTLALRCRFRKYASIPLKPFGMVVI
jgi:hypothetical protein